MPTPISTAASAVVKKRKSFDQMIINCIHRMRKKSSDDDTDVDVDDDDFDDGYDDNRALDNIRQRSTTKSHVG